MGDGSFESRCFHAQSEGFGQLFIVFDDQYSPWLRRFQSLLEGEGADPTATPQQRLLDRWNQRLRIIRFSQQARRPQLDGFVPQPGVFACGCEDGGSLAGFGQAAELFGQGKAVSRRQR